ncbi:hypothetical protein V8G54_023675 [Vigna mungo]|uniref:Uncharacterized protein n=1 Tax=Vigna mungo TaxID=3915 RepID=A0AAQ3RSF7_VIGMU
MDHDMTHSWLFLFHHPNNFNHHSFQNKFSRMYLLHFGIMGRCQNFVDAEKILMIRIQLRHICSHRKPLHRELHHNDLPKSMKMIKMPKQTFPPAYRVIDSS